MIVFKKHQIKKKRFWLAVTVVIKYRRRVGRMSKRQYIINLDMMLGTYYGLTGYYRLKLEDLETLSYKELDILKEKLETLLDEEEKVCELYELYSYYSC